MKNQTYYDYDLQVWVVNGYVDECGHPDEMKKAGCCNGHKYAGQKPEEVVS